MRLGGPLFKSWETPQQWTQCVIDSGYRAAYCPVDSSAEDERIREFHKAASQADIVIAEVGAWSNPMHPDESERKKAVEKCKQQLDLADRIQACCCVNIAGSCSEIWDGPSPENFTSETFDRVVDVVRSIIDEVNPSYTYYTLETMPWMFPDSPDSYLDLVKAINRKQFAVHLDPVNLICSPQRYYNTTEILKECFEKLGRYIKSCHAKDILLHPRLTTHLDEVQPGLGNLDYVTFIQEVNQLNPDLPVMLEHLETEIQYEQAKAFITAVEKRIT
jgi:sugar phosphate isomerase/epimerase